MKKISNLLPLILVGIYFTLIRTNDSISFVVKILILILIVIISLFIGYQKYKKDDLTRTTIIGVIVSILIAISIFFYYTSKIS
ncbi:MAG: hypothetical protein ACJAT0_001855 [Nonlabens sp.]|jgi:hypothetical protein